ncbi:TVP38/TMEM64 family protein [Patescibacteria group bacterium]
MNHLNHLWVEIKKHMVKVILILIVVVVAVVQLERFSTWLFTQGPDQLKLFFDGLGWFSIPFFIILYVVANVLLIPSYPFVFISGIVYGLWWGIALSLLGEVFSATVNFYIGRKFQRKFLVHKFKHKKIQQAREYVDERGFSVVLILRYLGFYFDIVSYAAGMTKIKYWKFIVATFIGFIPYIFIYVYAGNQLMDIKSSEFVYSILIFKLILFGLFVVVYGIDHLVKKIRKRHAK